ncbi:MAG: nucleotide exchange factor GrpE [Candidatus Acidiferrales bacterium]
MPSREHRERNQENAKGQGKPSAASSAASASAAPEESDAAVTNVATPSGDAGAVPSGEQVEKLQAEKQELMNMLVRRQADFENYRKRVEKERHQDRERGVELLIEKTLPVLDAIDNALVAEHDTPGAEEYRKGFELIRRQLWDVLAKQGVSRIETTGKQFNPHFHHAIESVEGTEHAGGTVISELQPGYVFHDRVLRPAMVRVAAETEPKATSVTKRSN